jgi:hypothetical protein
MDTPCMNGSGTAPQTIPPPSLQCHLFTTRRNYENSPSRRLHVSAVTRIMRGAISAAALASSLISVSTRPGVSPFGVSSAKGRVHGPLGDIQNFLRGGLPDFVRILDCLANLSRSQAGFMCFGNVEFNQGTQLLPNAAPIATSSISREVKSVMPTPIKIKYTYRVSAYRLDTFLDGYPAPRDTGQ